MIKFVLTNELTKQGTIGDQIVYSAFSSTPSRFTRAEVDTLVNSSGYGHPIVSAHPTYALANGYRVRGISSKRQLELQRDFDISNIVLKAAVSARKYGGAYIVPVITNTAALKRPQVQNEEVTRLIIAHRHELIADEGIDLQTIKGPIDPGFGLPNTYRYQPEHFLTGSYGRYRNKTALYQIDIDTSRMIYVAPATPSDELLRRKELGFEASIMDRCLEAIVRNLAIDSAASTQAAQMNAKAAFVSNLKTNLASDQQSTFRSVLRNMVESMSALNMTVMPLGDEIKHIGGSLAGFDIVTRRIERLLATGSRIPRSILFADADGGIGAKGSDELKLWLPEVQIYQQFVIKPVLEAIFQALDPDAEDVVFYSPEMLSQEDLANVGLSITNQVVIAVNNGLLTRQQARDALYAPGKILSRFVEVEPEDPMPPPPETQGGNLATSNKPKSLVEEPDIVDPQKGV